jgi:hypothetical protein
MTAVDRLDARALPLPLCGGGREGGNPKRQHSGLPGAPEAADV